MESYGSGLSRMWQVQCVKCGLVVQGLGPAEAERLQEALARRPCKVLSLAVGADGAFRRGSTPGLDTAVLDTWTGREWPTEARAKRF